MPITAAERERLIAEVIYEAQLKYSSDDEILRAPDDKIMGFIDNQTKIADLSLTDQDRFDLLTKVKQKLLQTYPGSFGVIPPHAPPPPPLPPSLAPPPALPPAPPSVEPPPILSKAQRLAALFRGLTEQIHPHTTGSHPPSVPHPLAAPPAPPRHHHRSNDSHYSIGFECECSHILVAFVCTGYRTREKDHDWEAPQTLQPSEQIIIGICSYIEVDGFARLLEIAMTRDPNIHLKLAPKDSVSDENRRTYASAHIRAKHLKSDIVYGANFGFFNPGDRFHLVRTASGGRLMRGTDSPKKPTENPDTQTVPASTELINLSADHSSTIRLTLDNDHRKTGSGTIVEIRTAPLSIYEEPETTRSRLNRFFMEAVHTVSSVTSAAELRSITSAFSTDPADAQSWVWSDTGSLRSSACNRAFTGSRIMPLGYFVLGRTIENIRELIARKSPGIVESPSYRYASRWSQKNGAVEPKIYIQATGGIDPLIVAAFSWKDTQWWPSLRRAFAAAQAIEKSKYYPRCQIFARAIGLLPEGTAVQAGSPRPPSCAVGLEHIAALSTFTKGVTNELMDLVRALFLLRFMSYTLLHNPRNDSHVKNVWLLLPKVDCIDYLATALRRIVRKYFGDNWNEIKSISFTNDGFITTLYAAATENFPPAVEIPPNFARAVKDTTIYPYGHPECVKSYAKGLENDSEMERFPNVDFVLTPADLARAGIMHAIGYASQKTKDPATLSTTDRRINSIFVLPSAWLFEQKFVDGKYRTTGQREKGMEFVEWAMVAARGLLSVRWHAIAVNLGPGHGLVKFEWRDFGRTAYPTTEDDRIRIMDLIGGLFQMAPREPEGMYTEMQRRIVEYFGPPPAPGLVPSVVRGKWLCAAAPNCLGGLRDSRRTRCQDAKCGKIYHTECLRSEYEPEFSRFTFLGPCGHTWNEPLVPSPQVSS